MLGVVLPVARVVGAAVGVPVALWVSSRVAGRSLRVAPAALAFHAGELALLVTAWRDWR